MSGGLLIEHYVVLVVWGLFLESGLQVLDEVELDVVGRVEVIVVALPADGGDQFA